MRHPHEIERLYLDFDGFFASVEQQVHPHLRGKPVGVVPFKDAQHTCVIEVLASQRENQAETFLGKLLTATRRKTCRIWAEQAPFEVKDQLKNRGYRWSAGTDGGRKSWYVDVDATLMETELRFLRTEIYGRDLDLSVEELDAFTRFSNRS
ncbi:MAG TPA: hypothetical protein VFC54_11095 [Pseudolabrys sp.]|nr:hypothetical protein [Pseudolabrys sp.]